MTKTKDNSVHFEYGKRLINHGYKTFELYYGNGGHGGPYPNIFRAVRRAIALLRGCPSETRITVRDRKVCDPRLATVVAVNKEKDMIYVSRLP